MVLPLVRPREGAVCSSGSQLPVPHLPSRQGNPEKETPERQLYQQTGRVVGEFQLMNSGYRLFFDDAHKAVPGPSVVSKNRCRAGSQHLAQIPDLRAERGMQTEDASFWHLTVEGAPWSMREENSNCISPTHPFKDFLH